MAVARPCLSAEEVADYVDPAASTDRSAVATHVDRCDACREVIAAAVRAARSTSGLAPVRADDHPGDRVDRYAVFEPLGAGGMGVVYRAYDPRLDRKIALKLLRPGLCDTKNRERMQREAKMLAKLAHPNVVAVYDADTWQDRVYIAMELVDGVTLKDWLAERGRTWREIVDVLVQAGEGLASAHAAGLVHQDFKPQNVLIGRDGRARVSDFGLARTTTGAIESGELAGTPAYMAPEQLDGGVPTERSDQFSLCVTLWEGLYGVRPFVGKSRRELRDAFARDPVAPSTGAPRHVVAALRRGLARDPAHRFDKLGDLLAALRPRTRRWAIATAAGVAASSLAVAAYAMSRDAAADGLCGGAGERFADVWNPARAGVTRRAFAATKLSYAADTADRVVGVFDRYGAEWTAARTRACEATRIRGEASVDVMDTRIACLDRALQGVDAVAALFERADAQVVQGAVNAVHGIDDPATCGRIDAVTGRMLPPAPDQAVAVAATRRTIAQLDALDETGKFGEAQQLATASRAAWLDLAYAPVRAEALFGLAKAALSARNSDAALADLEQATLAALRGRHDRLLPRIWTLKVAAESDRKHWDDALRASGYAESAADALGDPRAQIEELAERGSALSGAGRNAEALVVLGRAIQRAESLLPRDDPKLGRLVIREGHALWELGRFPESLERFRRAIAVFERAYGPGHPAVADARNDLASSLWGQGDQKQARIEYERVLATRRAVYGDRHPDVASALDNIANTFMAEGDDRTARTYREQAYDIVRAAYGDHDARVVPYLANLAVTLRRSGDYRAAIDRSRECVELLEQVAGKTHPNIAIPLSNLAQSLQALGDHDAAAAAYERALALLTKSLGDQHPNTLNLLINLGGLYVDTGRATKGLPLLQRALRGRRQQAPVNQHELATALDAVGYAYLALGEPATAVPYAEQAFQLYEATGHSGLDHAHGEYNLGRALWESGKSKARGLELVRAALAEYESLGAGGQRYVAVVRNWLAKPR